MDKPPVLLMPVQVEKYLCKSTLARVSSWLLHMQARSGTETKVRHREALQFHNRL